MKIKLPFTKREFNFGFEQPAQRTTPVMRRRSFAAAALGRLQSDWASPQTSADAEIGPVIRTLRGRSRELERNNEYGQGYLCLLENNVLGACGVQLEMKVMDPSGTMDNLANDAIKAAWKEWCKRDYCTMSGTQCFREVEGMAVRQTACAGGLLIREHQNADNKFGYSLEIIEIDCLDTDYNDNLRNGNQVRFGVEVNQWRKPIAYHVWSSHPGDSIQFARLNRTRIVLQATDTIHLFWKERPDQTIGIPWITSSMQALEHLAKYREAELVAARIAACKGYAIEQQVPSDYSGEVVGQDNREEMQPGMTMMLDPGQEMKPLDPTHPNTAFGDFVKSALRGAAAGLRINYNSLANDLESVNYSSMRAGKLEEVEEYMGVQEWLIESLHARIFPNWLRMALLNSAIKMPNGSALPLAKFDKFNAPDWKPRRWPWVDPQKDLTAAIMAINNRIKSRRQVIAEMGGDITTVDQEQAEDGDLNFVAKPVQGAIVQDSATPPNA